MLKLKYKKGLHIFVKIGASEIIYHNDFKLFLLIKNENHSFSPDLTTKVTIIDFTVSQDGLIEQLLIHVINNE